MEYYLGQLALFGFDFTPTGFFPCDGRLLPISQYSALFSLLGTTYGGNGTTTFALPDLRGRMVLGQGSGPGLTPRQMGEASGTETNTLTVNNLPAHNHSVLCTSNAGNSESPVGAIPATYGSSLPPAGPYATGTAANGTLAASTIAPAGGGQPVNNMQPFLVLNWCICYQGVYPSRS